jgi:hypothetical protein
MRAIVKLSMVGALGLTILASTTAVSVALDDWLSKPHCKCTCTAPSGNAKEIGWENTNGCQSNGRACSFTLDGGQSFTQGTLRDCKVCLPGYPTSSCSPALTSGSIQPQGTLQQR